MSSIRLKRSSAGLDPFDRVPMPAEGLADERCDERIVFDEQYGGLAFSGRPVGFARRSNPTDARSPAKR